MGSAKTWCLYHFLVYWLFSKVYFIPWLAIRRLRRLLARPPAVSSLRSLGPPAARSARKHPPRSLRSPPPPLGGRIQDCGLKQPQTGLEVGFEVAASNGLRVQIWGRGLERPRRSDWGRDLERPLVGALKCEEVIILQTGWNLDFWNFWPRMTSEVGSEVTQST